jgi:hypothetical protein
MNQASEVQILVSKQVQSLQGTQLEVVIHFLLSIIIINRIDFIINRIGELL